MSKKLKTIGVLTSGGDAPGMNAAIRAVVRAARFNEIHVKGIMKGYDGLMNNNMVDMSLSNVSGILQRGGTILRSARCLEFKEDAGVEQGRRVCEEAGIEGLIVIGGDGSFRGAQDLSRKGVPCIGIPGTIDNDIASTDYTIGFDTATNTVVQNIDRLRDTTESHSRCSVVEVMGRNCGDIALNAAISCGAECVLIPEIEYNVQRHVIEKLQRSQELGRGHFIIVVAEGVSKNNFGKYQFDGAEAFAQYIEAETGVETRATIIGHVQRGGSPTARDRVLAARMGHYAVSLLMNGASNRVVATVGGQMADFDIYEALKMEKKINERLFQAFAQTTI